MSSDVAGVLSLFGALAEPGDGPADGPFRLI